MSMLVQRSSGEIIKPNIDDAISLQDGKFCVNNQQFSTIVLQNGGENDWWCKQLLSLDSYGELHVSRKMEPEHLAAYRIFGSYINAAAYKTAQERPIILDVGCGIFPMQSPAFEQLDARCQYVGLDPLAHNLARSYPFVCGRIEELACLKGFGPRFDLFVFGTSLDHFEDLGPAARAVRSLAAPGALLVCWNGLQEPEKKVCSHAVAVFRKLLGYRLIVGAMGAYLAYGMFRLPRLLYRMKARANAIKRGEPLDHHLRWFTEANTHEYLSVFGEIIDVVALPYTNHCFVTVKVGGGT